MHSLRIFILSSLAALAVTAGAQTTGYLFYAGGSLTDAAVADPTQDGTPTPDRAIFSVLVANVDIAAGTVTNWRRATQPGNLLPDDDGGQALTWMFVENCTHVYNGRLYVGPGDWNGSDTGTADRVVWADIADNGQLGPISISDPIVSDGDDQAIGATAIVEVASGEAYYYVMGGTGGGLTRVAYAPINPDGSLGAWSTTTDLPTGDWFNRATTVGNTIIHGTGNFAPDRHIHTATASSGGGLSAWADQGVYQAGGARWDYAFVTAESASNTYAYIIGGADGTTLDSVRSAPVVGGVPGAWSDNTPLPAATRRLTAASVDDLIIQPGGTSPGSSSLDSVDTVNLGRIDSGGTITWSAAPTPMLQARSFGGAAFYRTDFPPVTGVGDYSLYR